VHDYHLMLVPSMLRALIPDAKIGFFLHIPFPTSEIYKCFASPFSFFFPSKERIFF